MCLYLEKGSRQSGSRPRVNADSDDDLPDIRKGQNREGTISKPRARRSSGGANGQNRTPSLDKEKAKLIDPSKRKLS